jgi:hypothetical protein
MARRRQRRLGWVFVFFSFSGAVVFSVAVVSLVAKAASR